jgi:hypothetical protein
MTIPVVTMKHCRRLGYCARGVREFFLRHKLDYDSFLKNGIPSSEISHIEDDMCSTTIKEASNGQQ